MWPLRYHIRVMRTEEACMNIKEFQAQRTKNAITNTCKVVNLWMCYISDNSEFRTCECVIFLTIQNPNLWQTQLRATLGTGQRFNQAYLVKKRAIVLSEIFGSGNLNLPLPCTVSDHPKCVHSWINIFTLHLIWLNIHYMNRFIHYHPISQEMHEVQQFTWWLVVVLRCSSS